MRSMLLLSLVALAAAAAPLQSQSQSSPSLDDAAIIGIFDLANTADI
jgi:hypothetical protein